MSFKQWMIRVWFSLCACVALAGCIPPSHSSLDEQKDPDFIKGKARFQAMDYKGAIESYNRALRTNPDSASAHFELGVLYEQHEPDYAAAIYHFRRYLALRPGDELADLVKQRIDGCKTALAKDVSFAEVSKELVDRSVQLEEDNLRLKEQVQSLKREIASLHAQLGVAARSSQSAESGGRTARGFDRPGDGGGRTAATSARIYVVQRGDTMYSVAKKHGISQAALQAANPTVRPTKMQVGQKLKIPSR